jgi:aminoglycoside phosphotransferase (APT) family kinase protein
MGDDGLPVETALAAAFPERRVAAVESSGPSWNDRNWTVEVQFETDDVAFLKVAVDGDGTRIARERAAITYADEHCAVTVPEIVACDASAAHPYLATRAVDGIAFHAPWADWSPDRRADGIRRVGASLAAIHDARFDRHGHVTGGDADALSLDSGRWTDVLVDRIRERRTIADSDRFAHRVDDVIAVVEDNRDCLDDAPATLVHGDPAMPNLFLCDGALGVVDWELAIVGDPTWDLHIARNQMLGARPLNHESRYVDALHAGYRAETGSLPDGFAARRPIYALVELLHEAGFFEKMVSWQNLAAEEYAQQLEDEFERRLDAIR